MCEKTNRRKFLGERILIRRYHRSKIIPLSSDNIEPPALFFFLFICSLLKNRPVSSQDNQYPEKNGKDQISKMLLFLDWGPPSYIGVWGSPSYLPFCLASVPDRALAKRQPHRANRTGPVVIIANHHRHHQSHHQPFILIIRITIIISDKTNVHIASSCTNEHQRWLLMLHCFQHRVIARTAVFGRNLICNWRCRTAVENLKFKSCRRKFLITKGHRKRVLFVREVWGQSWIFYHLLPLEHGKKCKKVVHYGKAGSYWLREKWCWDYILYSF